MNSGARAIDSPQNPRAKTWLALTEARGIRKHGAFLLSGRKTVPEALAAHGDHFTAALARTESELNRLSLPAHVERYVLAKPLFEALDTNGTGSLLMGEVRTCGNDLRRRRRGSNSMLALGDPANLGAVLRTRRPLAPRIVLMEGRHPFTPGAAAGPMPCPHLPKGGNWGGADRAKGIVALDGGDGCEAYGCGPLRLVLGGKGQGAPGPQGGKARDHTTGASNPQSWWRRPRARGAVSGISETGDPPAGRVTKGVGMEPAVQLLPGEGPLTIIRYSNSLRLSQSLARPDCWRGCDSALPPQ